MRVASAAFSLFALATLSAVPVQATTTGQLVGAGPGTVSLGGCSTPAVLAVRLDFTGSPVFPLDGYGELVFAQYPCGGYTNAYVYHCARAGDVLSCEGSNPTGATFTLADDGTFTYDAPFDFFPSETFHAEGKVAYATAIVP
jgi:hypothetical protein